jgi:pimeloyl-ACP methyl ester carboxylesterase
MTTTERPGVSWETGSLQVCGGDISFRRAGSGAPVIVLPRDNGHPPKQEFLESLSAEFTVFAPWLPGFHGSQPEQWEWLSSVRDCAMVLRQALGATGIGQPAVVGLGFGGWVAAEMAAMGPQLFSRIVLVSPMGIQPKNDYIMDQFLISTEGYARSGFADDAAFEAIYGAEPEFEQLESWETDREMTSRLAWKPYMFDPSLPNLLSGVTNPTLIAVGDTDRVVPTECAEAYQAALPNATLEQFVGAGHVVELEQPAALAAKVSAFLRA